MKKKHRKNIALFMALMMIFTLVIVPNKNVYATEDNENENPFITKNTDFIYMDDYNSLLDSFDGESYTMPQDGQYYYAQKTHFIDSEFGGKIVPPYDEISLVKGFKKACLVPIYKDIKGVLATDNNNENFVGYAIYGYFVEGGHIRFIGGTNFNGVPIHLRDENGIPNESFTNGSSMSFPNAGKACNYIINATNRVNSNGILTETTVNLCTPYGYNARKHKSPDYDIDENVTVTAVSSNMPIFSNKEIAKKFLDGDIGIEDSENYDKLQGLGDGQFVDDDGYLVDSTVPTFEQISCSLNKNYSDLKNYSLDFRYDLPADANANMQNYKIMYKYNYNANVYSLANPTTKQVTFSGSDNEEYLITSEKFAKHSYTPYNLYSKIQQNIFTAPTFLGLTYGQQTQYTVGASIVFGGISFNLNDILTLRNSNISIDVKLARKNDKGQWTYGKSSNFTIDTMTGEVNSFISQNTKDGVQVIDGSQGGTTIYNNNNVSGGGTGGGGSTSSNSGWSKLLDMIDNLFTTLTTLVIKILKFVIDTLNGVLEDLFKLLNTVIDGLKGLVEGLMDGFGLFSENGLIKLFSSMFPGIPEDIWVLVKLALGIVVLGMFIKIVLALK